MAGLLASYFQSMQGGMPGNGLGMTAPGFPGGGFGTGMMGTPRFGGPAGMGPGGGGMGPGGGTPPMQSMTGGGFQSGPIEPPVPRPMPQMQAMPMPQAQPGGGLAGMMGLDMPPGPAGMSMTGMGGPQLQQMAPQLQQRQQLQQVGSQLGGRSAPKPYAGMTRDQRQTSRAADRGEPWAVRRQGR